MISRRQFIQLGAWTLGATALSSAGLYGLVSQKTKRNYQGRIIGASSHVGHLLGNMGSKVPVSTREKKVVIVGGGISGLFAAWWFEKKGFTDYELLELENEIGGNSRWGSNSISAYPWGAHYVPLPGPEAHWVREFFEELGIIRGYDESGRPFYDDFFLCADPQERLLIHGRWQEGLVPHLGLGQEDHRQYDAFFGMMEKFKTARGRDGRRAFVIPMEESSHDPQFTKLDQISMAQFMDEQGWSSPFLKWYVNYCCRDDYGSPATKVSAWAGLHYFASRNGEAANADPTALLTWPEGNGWLVEKMRSRFDGRIHRGHLVYHLENRENHVLIDCLELATRNTERIRAEAVIFAAPRFVAKHVIPDLANLKPGYFKELEYAPWMVANVSLTRLPEDSGVPLSWDNVSYESSSLGYVVATHQKLETFPKKTVLTYYLPLDHTEPVEARKEALSYSHDAWSQIIVLDLSRMHPGIETAIEWIDICVFGHGMIRPSVGFLWGKNRQAMKKSMGRIFFAHSDMSGLSLFEEAQYWGIQAAQSVLDLYRTT